MAAAYASIPPSASPDDEAARDLSSTSTSPSTNASPTPFLSLPGATFSPLSMSMDSSDQFPDEADATAAEKPTRNEQKEQDETGAGLNNAAAATGSAATTTSAPGNAAAAEASRNVSPPANAAVADAALFLSGAAAAEGHVKVEEGAKLGGNASPGVHAASPPESSRPQPTNTTTTTSTTRLRRKPLARTSHPLPSLDSPPSPPQSSREDDGAEITSISRATGHAGSTPLGIPGLLTFSPSSRGANPPEKHRRHQSGDDNLTSIDTTLTSPPLSAASLSTQHQPSEGPSSPTSLIEQLQETIQSSASSPTAASSSTTTIHRPQPIVRTTSDSSRFTVRHPAPDLNTRSGAYVGNIAALEKTAERLSMTSSIEDAIRDLHGELKRSDSRRSSILAASVRGDNASPDEPSPASSAFPGLVPPPVPGTAPAVPRHVSSASNIVEVNNAARNGGYSPAAYVMSPNHSLTSRLRSGSKNSNGRPDFDVDVFMSRHGPGKGSTRSVRSTKLSLAEIAESEPTALNAHALNGADKLSLHERDDDGDLSPRDKLQHEPPKPSTDAFHQMLSDSSVAQQRPSVELRNTGYEDLYAQAAQQAADEPDMQHHEQSRDHHHNDNDRPATPRSTATSNYDSSNAFGDFDGVHCEPEVDFSEMPEPVMPEPRREMAPPQPRMARPQSYFDHQTGQQMMYYPARVPAMLNLPPKLSRKPKAAARNARHSRVLQAMGSGVANPEYMARHSRAPPVRESALWLPEPVESEEFAPFGQEATPPADDLAASPRPDDGLLPQAPPPARQRSPRNDELNEGQWSNQQDLPPHLRASAYFDLPSASPPIIEPKGGSAMAALDDILDASANAPVDAFTDHVFAGKLGHEVYGREKKKNRKSTATMLQVGDGPRKRASAMTLNKDGPRSTTNGSIRSGRAGADGPDDHSRSGSVDGDRRDEEDEEYTDDEDENNVYQGPPTTLLAELQLRKQQQKQRTRNLHLEAPGGIHSTLLELDAVAEAQRNSRKTRRVNLAWEDPAAAPYDDDSEDEDVPLGVLYAAKATGANDISAAVAELNRPIGLMERREMEDNEPLSARRARLQGHEPLTLAAARRSMMPPQVAARSATRLSRLPSPPPSPALLPRPEPTPPSEPDLEDESLADRLRRLRAKEEAEHNNLPRARPVSSTFSAELLSQFGDLDEKKPAEKTAPTGEEEEETLGQRRRRLQAEREARSREMGGGAGGPVGGNAEQKTRRRLSLADTLGAFPVKDQQNEMVAEAERRAAEDQRRMREQEGKMAAMRAQMPQALQAPTVGVRAGGFRGGTYNDGLGGGVQYNAAAYNPGYAAPGYAAPGYGATPGYGAAPAYGATPGYGAAPAYNPYAAGQYAPTAYGQMGMNTVPHQMPVQMPMAGQQQMNSIERWRQSVMQ